MRFLFVRPEVCPRVFSSHPASFRFRLTADNLAFYRLPASGRIRSFPPFETCTVGRTIQKETGSPASRGRSRSHYKRKSIHSCRRANKTEIFAALPHIVASVQKQQRRPAVQPLSSASLRPIKTPMADAIISPRVQPEESPRQCRPCTLVLSSSSIFTRFE